jgi:signal transduction histidine kinase/CheY-like chemotaxis protein
MQTPTTGPSPLLETCGELGHLLELLQEPALLLDALEVLYCNHRFAQAFPSSGDKSSQVSRALVRIASERLLPVITNMLMVDEGQPDVICVVTLTPLRNKQSFVFATFRNICELDSHTLAHVLQHERFRSCALPHVAFGISELDAAVATTTWIYLSPAAKELLSAPGGSGLTVLLRETARKWWISEMLSLETNGGFVHIDQCQQRFPELQAASVSLKRIADGPTGLPRYFWLAVEPALHTSPAAKLEELVHARTWELEEATQAKTRFLNTVSHEMRTPLCGIMGSLSLLEDTPLTPEQSQILRIASLSGEQLLVLINDVLDKSKMEDGKLFLETVSFGLHDLLADSLEMMATLAAQKGIELILDILPGVPVRAFGDPFRLRQIFFNLVSNACKFTKEGHVLLRAHAVPAAEGFQLCILVEDTGIGMSATVREQLFQPFTQADQSTRRQFGGTGLGLSIAQHLAHLMAGNITVDSIEGSGSKFHVQLSLASTSDPAPGGALPFNLGFQQKELVLVIRNATLRSILSRQLMEWGFRVVAAGTSAEALTLPRGHVTLLLADINGRPDDYILLREFNGVPTILLRQGGEEERLRQVFTIKSSSIILISKPVRTSELYEAVCRAVNPSQSGTAPSLEMATRQNDRRSLRVLLAEDNVTNQLIIGKMLRRLGQNNVTTVNNGRLAVDACRTTLFDVIFMDIMMPELNGWEATEEIRGLPSGLRVYIVALTAMSSSEDRQKCLAAGMDRVVAKPIVPNELAASLEAAALSNAAYHNSAADISA